MKISLKMRTLIITFYRPDESDHWINHLVTTFDPPYSHCDMLFDDQVATSIYQNESVYQEKKTFSRPQYDWIALVFTEDEIKRIREFCDRSFHNKVKFDFLGMLLAYLPYSPRKPVDKTFCSRFIWESLQMSQKAEFLGHDSRTMTPSRMHGILDAMNKKFMEVSPKRLMRLTN